MTDIKHLMLKLNQISSQYLGKIMYALFLISILETITSFAILSPVMRLSAHEVESIKVDGVQLELGL